MSQEDIIPLKESTPYTAEKVYEKLSEVIGHAPAIADITDENLKLLYGEAIEAFSLSTASVYLTAFVNFLKEYEDIIPSRNYRRILRINASTTTFNLEYLTRSEIEKIYRYKPKEEGEKLARCLFLLMAYTGADLLCVRDFDIYNVNGRAKTLFYTNSSGTDVSVPLHPYVEQLIREKMALSVEYHRTETLACLRSVCKKAGIKGCMEDGVQRYKTVIFETAQKSFATYLYTQKVEISDIQDVMGLRHRRHTTQMIVGYIKKTKKASIREAIASL